MRISANQVTSLRILLLPVPVYLLIYGDHVAWWAAFALFLFLGATDFVDGVMARREGPTKLGSLIDPVADKIFMAAVMLSFAALGMFPGYFAALILSRELLMTALRSSVAIRKESIKTSKLAKMKTIMQMGGSGTIFFTLMLPSAYGWLSLGLAVPFLVVALVYLFQGKKSPFWALPVFFCFIYVFVLSLFFSSTVALVAQAVAIAAITWISAIDYLIATYKIYVRTGMFGGDFARIAWAIVHGIFVVPLVATFPVVILPVLVSSSLEFGLGGIDNIVVAEKERFRSWPFVLSSIAGLIFAILTNLSLSLGIIGLPFYGSLFLMMASLAICSATFIRHLDLFKKSF